MVDEAKGSKVVAEKRLADAAGKVSWEVEWVCELPSWILFAGAIR